MRLSYRRLSLAPRGSTLETGRHPAFDGRRSEQLVCDPDMNSATELNQPGERLLRCVVTLHDFG